MKKLILSNIIFGVLSIFSFKSNAQSITMDLPRVSQAAATEQRIGITDLRVEYHRPAAKDRNVWGGIIPYNQGKPFPWRAGANENTIFENSTEVMIEGEKLPAGKYGLHMIANENEVEVIFSHNSTSWGSFSYNSNEDALRVKTPLTDLDETCEYLTYQFSNPQSNSVLMELLWGDKKLGLKIETESNELAFQSVIKQLQSEPGWTWLGWNEAANFCLQNEIHLRQGLQWANRSVSINPNPNNMLVLAKLSAKVNNPDKAEEVAVVESFDKVLTSMPVTWKEWNAAAAYCMNNDVELEKGLKFADKSVEMNPIMQNQMNKAIILQALKRKEEADEIKKQAMEKATNAQLNAYGYSLLYGGKAKESIEVFEFNAEKNPKDPNVFDSLGEAYFRNGMEDEARQAFKTSLSLNPPANVKANSMNFLGQMGLTPEEL